MTKEEENDLREEIFKRWEKEAVEIETALRLMGKEIPFDIFLHLSLITLVTAASTMETIPPNPLQIDIKRLVSTFLAFEVHEEMQKRAVNYTRDGVKVDGILPFTKK